MICRNCGSNLNPGDTKCNICGCIIEGASVNQNNHNLQQQNFQQQPNPQQQNYQQQPNFQQGFPQQYYRPQPSLVDKILGNSSWKLNLGWMMAILSLFCLLSNLFFSTISFSLSRMDSNLNFSIINVLGFSDFAEEISGGDAKFLTGGYHALVVFVWIFTGVSLGLTIFAIYKLLVSDVKSSLKFTFYSVSVTVVAKIFAIIAVIATNDKEWGDDINISFSVFLMLFIAIAEAIFIAIYANKNNISILPTFANRQYMNPYQPYPNQYPNMNMNQNPNMNSNMNPNMNMSQNLNMNMNQYQNVGQGVNQNPNNN